MNTKTFIIGILIPFTFIGSLISCKHESVKEKFDSIPSIQSIQYSPNNIEILTGTSFSSVIPTTSPNQTYAYNINVIPNNDNIKINPEGQITINNVITEGNYVIDVIVSNSAGSRTFENIYTVKVSSTPTPPSALNYPIDSIGVSLGTNSISSTPSISGTFPFTYSIVSDPVNPEISISNSGEISSTSSLTLGTYYIDVTVTNSAGSKTFENAYIITSTNLISFDSNILPLIESKCGSCHTGGSRTNYTVYNNSKNNINSILNRIQRVENSPGFMPASGSKLSDNDIAKFQKWLDDGLLK